MRKLYSFSCPKCQHSFEDLWEDGSEKPKCEKCGTSGNIVPAIGGSLKFRLGKTLLSSDERASNHRNTPGLKGY
ncbi:MAG: hypothetical protein CVV64_03950 [Candidatus Wallbacteria bacterium HGW-Wallbacteria-1]|uniref:Uncharacterized protein n=1 Tax=Candidatus Wallbacteria bacterium HGW-Wallbacteria-1 TaxID=2013854 RepID=A0A2N1PRF6_9BACT|nr:MAG: hypothetical protein CVV64_03950 [Candidatus Wallbacteria bacterium HGW-Wallbacteria-1]